MGDSDDIENEALRWHRTMAGEGADWDAFTLWLEADPARARAGSRGSANPLSGR